ncbi:hypothetical protein DPMN_018756 [Dreissena polymorpha]|uniref:Uncharacterized protein n=1 Tax=Dreissena polymorpha TaxID=45954 RepID=A0A9D4S6N6_DREPO|nr:hypothetical protein DPMN_018756 [Dreissena polymorpha]
MFFSATDQLEKSREIIKRLKAEKSEAIADLESRLKEYETKMNMENENLQKQGSDTVNQVNRVRVKG